jgi:hypothetical protein
MKFVAFLTIIFCIDLFSYSSQQVLSLSQIFNNKLLYQDFTSFNTEDDYFKLKIIKLLKKVKKTTGMKIYTLITSHEQNSTKKLSLYNNLFNNLISSHKLSMKDSLVCIDKINAEFLLSSNQLKVKAIFQSFSKYTKEKFKKDILLGGYEYATYYLIKEISSYFPKKRISNYKLKINTEMETERDNMLKSLFILPIIFLLCYSYIFGLFSKDTEESLLLKPSRLEKIGINEIFDKSCLICLEDFLKKKALSVANQIETEVLLLVKEKNSPQILKLECGHIFHPLCLNKWLKAKHKCPTCRHDVKSNSNYNFYMIEELE